MSARFVWSGAVIIAALTLAFAASSSQTRSVVEVKAARWQERLAAQRHSSQRQVRLVDPRAGIPHEPPGQVAKAREDVSRVVPRPSSWMSSSSVAAPPPSPGIALGATAYDMQYFNSGGYQTARLAGADCVHFCWTAWDRLPSNVEDNDRYVDFRGYTISTGVISYPFPWGPLINESRAGYPNLDVDDQNRVHVALYQRQDPTFPYHAWRIQMPLACNFLHVDDELGGTDTSCFQVLWPRIAASRGGDSAIIHELAIQDLNDCQRGLLYYWRNTGGAWTGPVVIDSSEFVSYVIADDPNSNKVAVVLNPRDGNSLLNVAYHESNTSGYGWIDGSELGPGSRYYLTNYTDVRGPQAWPDLSVTYDNSGTLHAIFLEQRTASYSELARILHWSSARNSLRPAAQGYYVGMEGLAYGALNLGHVTVGIGDGSTLCNTGFGAESNQDYVYVCYTKFGGPTATEQADISAHGFWNGELYLTVSNSGGNTWSPPINLTSTKTPSCNPGLADTISNVPLRPDSVCRSEDWASLGRAVSDIDIFFISDLDAGAIPQGEGTWQMNPVMYLRLPGGTPNAQYVCPILAPVFAAVMTSRYDCEYHSSRTGTDVETLTISNLGSDGLSGEISVTDFPGAATLTLSGGPGPYAISAGGPDVTETVTMAANGVPEGLYQGTISITHNDVTQFSPKVFPIDYFVVNNFFCPEDNPQIRTGVTNESIGSLWLRVESNGRFASQNNFGGLWRYSDSSSSIFDGSLLLAHGTQGPDTTVYLRFFHRATNGQYGFRALTDLIEDTTAFRTGSGFATAYFTACTADSVVGVKSTWYFPQDPANDDYVLVQYKVYRNRPSVPITNLAIGVLAEMDVVPAQRLGTIQIGANNEPAGDADRRLVYQIGVDTLGHQIVGTKTATRFRAGVTACGRWKGAYVGNTPDDLQPGGGPTDGFLYRQLTQQTGIDLFTDSAHGSDLYTLVSLDRGRSLGQYDTATYVVLFASDTISDVSLKATIDAGLASASASGLCGSYDVCLCAYEPHCDGVVSDVLDVVETIDRAFRGAAPVIDPGCPFERCDVDCSGATDVLDVTKVTNVAFRGMTPGSQYDLDPFAPGDQ